MIIQKRGASSTKFYLQVIPLPKDAFIQDRECTLKLNPILLHQLVDVHAGKIWRILLEPKVNSTRLGAIIVSKNELSIVPIKSKCGVILLNCNCHDLKVRNARRIQTNRTCIVPSAFKVLGTVECSDKAKFSDLVERVLRLFLQFRTASGWASFLMPCPSPKRLSVLAWS